jgi:hypothetical protein
MCLIFALFLFKEGLFG